MLLVELLEHILEVSVVIFYLQTDIKTLTTPALKASVYKVISNKNMARYEFIKCHWVTDFDDKRDKI